MIFSGIFRLADEKGRSPRCASVTPAAKRLGGREGGREGGWGAFSQGLDVTFRKYEMLTGSIRSISVSAAPFFSPSETTISVYQKNECFEVLFINFGIII